MISNVREEIESLMRRAVMALGLGLLVGASTAPAGDVRGRDHSGHGAHGFQGFGLGYHLRHGYGGDALGVGPFGGYPFYGGPGYPHPAPRLRRIGGINPFPYHGGPGHSTPSHPNSFSGTGPLVVSRPVVTIIPTPGQADDASGFGGFTGTLPYPENYFAPFTSAAAATATPSGATSSHPVQIPGDRVPED